jgi:hypothetical protein
MQSHGITLAFHREMADSSRELVGPDITAAATLERYPGFIKGGSRITSVSGSKDPLPIPSMFPPYSRGCQEQRLLESPSRKSRIFGINQPSERSFQIALEHRGTSGELLDQSSNQVQEFLLLRSVAGCDEKGSDLNVLDLST